LNDESTAQATIESARPLAVTAYMAPPIKRRLACMLYEGVLLFGVVMVVALIFAGLMQQRNAMTDRHGLQAALFAVLGLYFTWFWSHGGQTVAMKTWHIRVLDRAGRPVSAVRALARYVASWMFFMPALAALYFQGTTSTSTIFATLALGAICYAALALLHPSRQYWHDIVCGTQLVTQHPAAKNTAKTKPKPKT
jgi:uncharacterized RDD family membrane protein YckC